VHTVPNPKDNRQARWRREETATIQGQQLQLFPLSQRQTALALEVPRSTLQYWAQRDTQIQASHATQAFFSSLEGLAFLHRIQTALHLVFSFQGIGGIRLICRFLEYTGLDAFMGASEGSQKAVARDMEQALPLYDREQRGVLVDLHAAPKEITICQDETFHPEVCLVGMEPVSGFLLLEKYAEDRKAITWTSQMKEATEGLNVQIVQACGDEGTSLLSHAKHDLMVPHVPELFHVQQPLVKATARTLASQTKVVEELMEEAAKSLQKQQRQQQEWTEEPCHRPGRPPDFQGRIHQAQERQNLLEELHQEAKQRQEQAVEAIRAIGESHRPVDPKTGALRSPEEVKILLEQQFTFLKGLGLPDKNQKQVEASSGLVNGLVGAHTFFQKQVDRRVEAAKLTEMEENTLRQMLIPVYYLKKIARQSEKSADRKAILEVARGLEVDWKSAGGQLEITRLKELNQLAQDCSELFVRSSSCVEGRNGQLSLRHHGLHRIRPARLRALTVVHNYLLRRADGSTAAERFFRKPAEDLFGWLLTHLPVPVRPAPRRPAAGSVLVGEA
jgi:hypothetical protein